MNAPDRPPPRRPRRMPAADRGPQALAAGLDEVLAALRPPGGAAGVPERPPGAPASAWAAVFSGWEGIVGPALARHTRPVRMDADVLVVAVDRPPWATQVRALGPAILTRVGEASGSVPGRLEVVIRAP